MRAKVTKKIIKKSLPATNPKKQLKRFKKKQQNMTTTSKLCKKKRVTESELDVSEEADLNDKSIEENRDSFRISGPEEVDSGEENTDDEQEEELTAGKHKKALKNLKKIDPEFHEFLQENDKDLLNFDFSGSELEDGDEEENLHIPTDTLEVASDESDYEDKDIRVSGKITIQMIDAWGRALNANKRSMKPVGATVRAFHACLIRVSGDEQKTNEIRVDGSAEFNAVIRLCVTSLYPYLKRLLNLPDSNVTKKHVQSSRRWTRAKVTIRSYLIDLIKLMGSVTSEDVLRVLLKHLHQMLPFVACLPTLSKLFLKQLVLLWSTSSDDTVRVISFLCILRYAISDLNVFLQPVLKKMYVSYVTNCKFVSQNSIPAINFMRKSLTEMFSLNEAITYNHAFLYIRQLAIHLRSAITLKKKDSIQTVYNWQFISSLQLWVEVLCHMQEKPQVNSLLYPTVQVIIGCIKLIPTAQYFPLRFHCLQMLIKISRETSVFIPVLPFLIDSLTILNVNAQHKKMSLKPMDFTYILRLSKSQLQENSFKDAVIENVYDCLLEYTESESYRISFPDTVVFLLIQMKQFLKDCKNMNYSKKIKPLLEKIEEVSKTKTQERIRSGIALSNAESIAVWESNMKLKSNPLMKFYESWSNMKKQKLMRKSAESIHLKDYELPTLTKLPGIKKKTVELKRKDGKVVLFDSDAESDTDFNFQGKNEESMEKHGKKKDKFSETSEKSKSLKRKMKTTEKKETKKKMKEEDYNPNEAVDVVTDLKLSDFLS